MSGLGKGGKGLGKGSVTEKSYVITSKLVAL